MYKYLCSDKTTCRFVYVIICIDRKRLNIDSGVEQTMYVYRGVSCICTVFEAHDYTVNHLISYCDLENKLKKIVG